MSADTVHDRDAAWALLTEWTESEALLRHAWPSRPRCAPTRGKCGEDEDAWGNVALLHDFDYERHPTLDQHPQDGAPVLREHGYPEWFVRAVLSHGDHRAWPARRSSSARSSPATSSRASCTPAGWCARRGSSTLEPRSRCARS